MKKIISLGVVGLVSLTVLANEKTNKNWNQQLRSQGLDASAQAYCYTNENGKIEGVNTEMRVRLASVSKLLVSLWSSDKLGTDFKYNTKLFIKDNNLHIQGSYDPFLGNEKMFFLLSQLNDLGYTKFDTITFDKNLLIFPDAQYEVDEYPVINAASNTKNLKKYFNTESWTEDTKQEYLNYFAIAKPGKFRKEVNFEVANVQSVDKNPFENDSTAKVLTLSSPALYKYLKEMNTKSNNYVAETIFRQLGGVTKFQQYLSQQYNLSDDKIRFYSGSGLPTFINGERKDNYATCSTMTELVSELKNVVEKQNREIEDVVAVPGSDRGTFRNRIFPSDYKNSFVAKTGTLMHTSTLSGMMNTKKGFSYFGIFNQSTDIGGSKAVQNSMVVSIMTEMGGPVAFNYEVDGFHTYFGDILKMFENESDFSSVEEGLF